MESLKSESGSAAWTSPIGPVYFSLTLNTFQNDVGRFRSMSLRKMLRNILKRWLLKWYHQVH